MMVRELRWGLFGRETRLVRLFYLSFILSFGSAVAMCGAGRNYVGWFLFQIGVVAITTPALLGNILTKEYELGNIDMLRTTLLLPKEIIDGKLLSGAISIAPMVLGIILSLFPLSVIAFVWNDSLQPIVVGCPTLFLCAFLSLAVTVAVSLLTRRTVVSLFLSYGCSALLLLGGAGVAYLHGLVRIALGSPVLQDYSHGLLSVIISQASPISAYVLVATTRQPGMVALWLIHLGVFFYIGRLLISASTHGFARLRMKDA